MSRIMLSRQTLRYADSGIYVCKRCAMHKSSVRQLQTSGRFNQDQAVASTDTNNGPRKRTYLGLKLRDRRAERESGLQGFAKAADDPAYTPAQTYDGLERIGGARWLETQQDDKPTYTGFARKRSDEPISQNALHDILLDAAKEVAKTSDDPLLSSSLEEGGEAGVGWLDMPFRDTRLKFQVSRKVYEKTGLRLADHALQHAHTLRKMRTLLTDTQTKKPGVTKLDVSDLLSEIQNVEVYSSRVTSIDKEKKVGRWKLIEQALKDKGLPITGHTTETKSTFVMDTL